LDKNDSIGAGNPDSTPTGQKPQRQLGTRTDSTPGREMPPVLSGRSNWASLWPLSGANFATDRVLSVISSRFESRQPQILGR
jgi:hypothetical protein